jgi:hypothetical protein
MVIYCTVLSASVRNHRAMRSARVGHVWLDHGQTEQGPLVPTVYHSRITSVSQLGRETPFPIGEHKLARPPPYQLVRIKQASPFTVRVRSRLRTSSSTRSSFHH